MLIARWIAVLAGYAALIALGIGVSHLLYSAAAPNLIEGEILGFNKMVIITVVIYVVAAALPFVPGAEIGLAMMMIFGAQVAVLVYLSMILALSLSFLAGRFVSSRILIRFLRFLRLERAARMVGETLDMRPADRLEFLMSGASRGAAPFLLRNRYLGLAAALNIPGNSILGGGGGLALFAGLSGLFSIRGFFLTIVLAVAPIPLMILILGYHP